MTAAKVETPEERAGRLGWETDGSWAGNWFPPGVEHHYRKAWADSVCSYPGGGMTERSGKSVTGSPLTDALDEWESMAWTDRARISGWRHAAGLSGLADSGMWHAPDCQRSEGCSEHCAFARELPERYPAWVASLRKPEPAAAVVADPPAPIPMVLHCPACGLQHVDAAEPERGWTNPPHRSHLCHGCGSVWRPADVPTTGVQAVTTRGSVDNLVDQPARVPAEVAAAFHAYVQARTAASIGAVGDDSAGAVHTEQLEAAADAAHDRLYDAIRVAANKTAHDSVVEWVTAASGRPGGAK